MDNCSRNGEQLHSCVTGIAYGWNLLGYVDDGFIEYLNDENIVSFPFTMIDKITPRPSKEVEGLMKTKGVDGMEPLVTSKQTFIAPFVNSEKPGYLVIEDKFPNGRPPLEKAGAYLADQDTVNKTERMKVTTCLNPLHTAMSIYGCLLGYERICDEMKDVDIVALISRLGYVEGLPVVTDPGIISPQAFIDEVIKSRLPNPFIPDDPRRIATDTSQKVGIRFGETIKSYVWDGITEDYTSGDRLIGKKRDLNEMVAIPLAIAGWFRYLLGVDDKGQPMEVSPDPMKEELTSQLSGVVWDDPSSYQGQLVPILSNSSIFGLDLSKTPLAKRIEEYFILLLNGPGAVRNTLQSILAK